MRKIVETALQASGWQARSRGGFALVAALLVVVLIAVLVSAVVRG